MPGFDKTGPEGEGAMTGRRMGCCTGYGAKLKKSTQSENTDGLSENDSRRGFGFGRRGRGGGRGFGLRNRFRGGE
ncbi:MAG: DUF5320 domain-containing protein [Bacteroidales bacterium]|jgi:hypothetical protein|nr:DUF5320 domain-containing protein [Bacteroidales bacterium]